MRLSDLPVEDLADGAFPNGADKLVVNGVWEHRKDVKTSARSVMILNPQIRDAVLHIRETTTHLYFSDDNSSLIATFVAKTPKAKFRFKLPRWLTTKKLSDQVRIDSMWANNVYVHIEDRWSDVTANMGIRLGGDRYEMELNVIR